MPRACATIVSRDLFARILANEEEHVDTLEKQFDMIERMGLQNYIQLQSKPAEEYEPGVSPPARAGDPRFALTPFVEALSPWYLPC